MRKSSASFGCLSLTDGEGASKLPKSLESLSGVRGGVDISEPLLVGAKRGHGTGREKFEGLIEAMGNFARERDAESERYLSGDEDRLSLGNTDVRLPVTQSDDPLFGGHFALGTSKAPLVGYRQYARYVVRWDCTHPRSARKGSRVIVHVICALKVAHGKHTGLVVERKRSPIPNGSTTVAIE
jgi:hypothetical protein